MQKTRQIKQTHLYNDLVRFYYRSMKKLQRLVAEGKDRRKQDILQRRLSRLFKKLTCMQRTVKLAMATAALSAGMLIFQPDAAKAQVITFYSYNINLTDIGESSAPAFADMDADGDLDMIAGEEYGSFFYFQNTGTVAAPVYAAPVTNPFGLTGTGYPSAPAFADLDADGDLDMMSGEYNGSFIYFQNTGTVANPVFDTAVTNPFGLTNVGSDSSPAFADLDADGDLDMITGEAYGSFFYFQNTGTAAIPVYAATVTNPFGLTNIGTHSSPAFADMDADGDLDMISGEYSGSFFYFQNTGTAANPIYAGAQTNPFGLSGTGIGSSPAFADLDADGDLDMTTGGLNGDFFFFHNTGTVTAPAFEAAPTNPFDLPDIGYLSSPAFADLDADGDLDMMAGEYNGSLFYFQNTGTAANPVYAAAVTNPFGLTANGYDPSPAFADLDADGDLDMMSGELNSNFFYFQNTGTATNPVYAAAATNPFGLMDIGYGSSSPTFADLDGDGDLDMMSGELDGSFFYFQNTGTVAAPVYAAPVTNPFGLTGIGFYSSPAFADLDADGDLDMLSGEYYGSFFYFQNTGTAANPVYAAAVTDPFGLTNVGSDSSPAFADLNADGDLDMMSGEFNGNFFYFENSSCSGLTVFADGDGDGFGDAANMLFVADCNVPAGYVINSTDCDDNDATVHTEQQYYVDADIDGYGSTTTAMLCSTTAPLGYSTDSTDCNDNNANVNPGVTEVSNNGIDDNCNGDVDEFGVGVVEPGGSGSFNLFPNPAIDQVTIQFAIGEAMQVTVKVNDLIGKESITLLNDQLQQGEHVLQLNTTSLVMGVYLVKISFGNGMEKNVKLIVQ